ncbi:hypothetical protein [Micromonospora yangpuensis]|uniref:Uncharacterized protein n=1 Tax=Micromonospora yangpuensis TaxID=683228 RepID=A0A1C6V1K7_9ACTN|nr:hypothetical protein [Micromonospora yangpuensis]GGL97794.1 hypothetical protein GCM10012279_14070 [Micromonospora yangpuensis]SCL60173.1 hypothetical protein GA0070617_4303 [Micromonospora yangpuensis]
MPQEESPGIADILPILNDNQYARWQKLSVNEQLTVISDAEVQTRLKSAMTTAKTADEARGRSAGRDAEGAETKRDFSEVELNLQVGRTIDQIRNNSQLAEVAQLRHPSHQDPGQGTGNLGSDQMEARRSTSEDISLVRAGAEKPQQPEFTPDDLEERLSTKHHMKWFQLSDSEQVRVFKDSDVQKHLGSTCEAEGKLELARKHYTSEEIDRHQATVALFTTRLNRCAGLAIAKINITDQESEWAETARLRHSSHQGTAQATPTYSQVAARGLPAQSPACPPKR